MAIGRGGGPDAAVSPRASIVIPALNAATSLARTLNARIEMLLERVG